MRNRAIGRRAFMVGAGLLVLASCAGRPGGGGATGVSREAAAAIRRLRRDAGLAELAADAQLERAAIEQASHMAVSGRMAHDTGRGRDFATRMSRLRTNGQAAENLARGRFDTQEVLQVWMNSAGHRRNMLTPAFGRFGLAHAVDPRDPRRRFWAMVLAA